jgi:pSer/pThr/pTyr-binding forkhead associated (FHA) protein
MPKLVVLSEGFKGRSYDLKVDKTTIGRVDDNSFQLEEPSVSSHHCEVFLRGNDVVVKDLNSTNGTYINGEKVSEGVLKPGQVLRLGQIDMQLQPGGAATPPGKKGPDQTRVIGVKLNELEQGSRQPGFDKNSPFAKKSNKPAMIFITIGVVLAVIILIFLFIAFRGMS